MANTSDLCFQTIGEGLCLKKKVQALRADLQRVFERLEAISVKLAIIEQNVAQLTAHHEKAEKLKGGVIKGLLTAATIGAGGVFLMGLKVWLER